MEAGKLHAILWVSDCAGHWEWLRAHNVPVVGMGQSGQPHTAYLDYSALVRQGCRCLGLIAPFELASKASDAFSAELARCGLPERSEWIWCPSEVESYVLPLRPELGAQGLRHLLTARPGLPTPDGVIILDDLMTAGAIPAARELGLNIGRDLKIASHANKGSPVLKAYEPDLTLLEFDSAELVEAMFGMLERLMEGEDVDVQAVAVKPKARRQN